MKELDINGFKELIIERSDYPIESCKKILDNETTAILGYGPQGRGQGLNMRDQGFDVILGLRKGESWDKAIRDGWLEGENLFEIEEATKRGTIIQFLLSDAGQIQAWPTVKENLNEGDTLYFSHGFGIIFHDDTNTIPHFFVPSRASEFRICLRINILPDDPNRILILRILVCLYIHKLEPMCP